MITAPGDDSRDDENMVSPPPVVMFKLSCVEARSDPGPVLEIIAADNSPLARERVPLQGGGGTICIKSFRPLVARNSINERDHHACLE